MPSYSQSPSPHEKRFAMLCSNLWRMRRGRAGFSWFHHPVWKHGIKRWWQNHLTVCACARLLQPDGDGLTSRETSRLECFTRSIDDPTDGPDVNSWMVGRRLLPIRGYTFEGPAAIGWWWSVPVSPPLDVQEDTETINCISKDAVLFRPVYANLDWTWGAVMKGIFSDHQHLAEKVRIFLLSCNENRNLHYSGFFFL